MKLVTACLIGLLFFQTSCSTIQTFPSLSVNSYQLTAKNYFEDPKYYMMIEYYYINNLPEHWQIIPNVSLVREQDNSNIIGYSFELNYKQSW